MGLFANGHRDHVDEMQSGHPEADTALAASRTFLEQANAFKLLSGYESKILRALEKHQAQLKTLQAERKAAYEKAVEQATQFVELAEATEETYEPGEDFTPASAYGRFFFARRKSTVAGYVPRTFVQPGSTVLRANCRIGRRNRTSRSRSAPHNAARGGQRRSKLISQP
jgi:hypothetical protein